MYTLNICLIIGSFFLTTGLDIQIDYCRFRCDKSCETTEDKSNPNGVPKAPKAYYYRDFYGVIPPDAFPLGPPNQFPQTYIGMVFDPHNNGTFITTIYEGLDYVYNAVHNDTIKIVGSIQILCTESPESLVWLKVSSEDNTAVTSHGYRFITAASHLGYQGRKIKHYIAKTNKCHIAYVGVASTFTAELEYALIDGSYASSDDYLWLLYKTNDSIENPEAAKSQSSKRFFSHHYEYQIRPDSIIPKFYRKLTIGSCSLTCTNEDKIKREQFKGDMKLSSSMAYFWQPIGVIDKDEAFAAGSDLHGEIQYIGQADILGLSLFDVGPSNLESTSVSYGGYLMEEHRYFHESLDETSNPAQYTSPQVLSPSSPVSSWSDIASPGPSSISRETDKLSHSKRRKMVVDAALKALKEDDEFDGIGLNVACKLRRMAEEQKEYAEILINKVLMNGLKGWLQEETDLCDLKFIQPQRPVHSERATSYSFQTTTGDTSRECFLTTDVENENRLTEFLMLK